MVELKKKKRKRKVKPRAGQIISQKVVVNLGKTAPRRRTGTQAKRSTQPQQVTYQNAPIPLTPDYSSRINDLRDEVVRHLSGVDKEAGRRRALDLRVEEGKQATSVQTERQDKPPPPRRTRSDSGMPRGELLRTAQARAEQRGFSMASVPIQTPAFAPPASAPPALAPPAPLKRQETPPRIVTMLETIEEKKRPGRQPGFKLTEEQKKKRSIIAADKKKREQEVLQKPTPLERFESAEEPAEIKPGTFV